MADENENINPWAKKMQAIKVPQASDSWQAMSALLDAEMPVQVKGRRRRVLLTLLLLLLVGVCHYPQTGQVSVPGIPAKEAVLASNKKDKTQQVENKTGPAVSKEMDSISEHNLMQNLRQHSDTTEETGNENAFTNKNRIARARQIAANSKQENSSMRVNKQADAIPESAMRDETGLNNQNKKDSGTSFRNDSMSSFRYDLLGKSRIVKSPDSVKPIPKRKDTKKPDPDAPQTEEKTDAKGWAFGIGLNQFFAVGDQQKSNFNADGTSGTIADYIPVPVVRYYFHNWLYVQAEAQINSPQYTKTLLAGQGIKAANASAQEAVQSVFIKKLFYFNIPVSIHYSPFRHLFFGAGLQYSRLTNGLALFQDTRLNGGFVSIVVRSNDTTLIVSKLGNFKHDSAYQELKTNEWRFLLDLNYQWKRATVGLRYNQAFSDFINIRISPVNITQAQNSSIQLYLRYLLVDRRKKIRRDGHLR